MSLQDKKKSELIEMIAELEKDLANTASDRDTWKDFHQLRVDAIDEMNQQFHVPVQVDKSDPRYLSLKGAAEAILRDRNASYGEPEDNFANIAEMWNSWLMVRYNGNVNLATQAGHEGDPFEFDSFDVSIMMVLLKVARTVASPDVLDHFADMAGYAGTAARIGARMSWQGIGAEEAGT